MDQGPVCVRVCVRPKKGTSIEKAKNEFGMDVCVPCMILYAFMFVCVSKSGRWPSLAEPISEDIWLTTEGRC